MIIQDPRSLVYIIHGHIFDLTFVSAVEKEAKEPYRVPLVLHERSAIKISGMSV